jgi:hypothetical protein
MSGIIDSMQSESRATMRGFVAVGIGLAVVAFCAPAPSQAAAIVLATPFVVPGFTATGGIPGISFTYSGTLTGSDTLALTATGYVSSAFVHGNNYNAAGVSEYDYLYGPTPPSGVYFDNASPVDSSGYNYYALLLVISGVGEAQLLRPDAATGLDGSTIVNSVTLASTALSALGFGSFSVTNPTLTFLANVPPSQFPTGSFRITQDAVAVVPTPEPGSVWLLGAGLAGGARLGWAGRPALLRGQVRRAMRARKTMAAC